MDTSLQHRHWVQCHLHRLCSGMYVWYWLTLFMNKEACCAECGTLKKFLLRDKRVHIHYDCETLSWACLVKVTQQANHPHRALFLCGPHLVTQVCFYRRYTCVLVGSPKYVQWKDLQYLTHSQLASRATTDPPCLPTVPLSFSASFTCSCLTSEYFAVHLLLHAL